jgi:hypothetical protein
MTQPLTRAWLANAGVRVGMLCFLAIACSSIVAAQTPATSYPDLTGFWVLRFDSRNVPSAKLVASIGSKQKAEHDAHDQHIIRWCLPLGMPHVMDGSGPIGIVQGGNEIAIRSEAPSAARHVYLRRSSPPGADVYESTSNGFSIGQWDGNALIVETSGFNDKGYSAIPGGGFVAASSHLTERYELLDRGRQLQVTFTWTDPHVFAAAHTYAYRYYRTPAQYNAGEVLCDSHDTSRADFLTKGPASVPIGSRSR